MTHFEKYGYELVHDVVNEQTSKLLSETMRQEKKIYFYEKKLRKDSYAGDPLVKKSFTKYSLNCLEVLCQMLLPKMEEITGKRLFPTYTYSRIYYEGAEMSAHLDRPSCEYSATLTLSISEEPWEIWIKDLLKNDISLKIPVGSMCVYKGREMLHWRNKYEGKEQIQVFLHYVDVNGPCAKFRYDGRPMMGLPTKKDKSD